MLLFVKQVGLVTLTDLQLDTRPCEESWYSRRGAIVDMPMISEIGPSTKINGNLK